MLKLVLLSCVIVSVVSAANKKEAKSSSIVDTESEHDVMEDSGISESGLSRRKSSSEYESESEVKKTTPKATAKKKLLKSSKFPLQFKKETTQKTSSEDESTSAEVTMGKKVFKDVGFRKEKFKEAMLKEKRRQSSTSASKKKKPKTTQPGTKKTRAWYSGPTELQNVSDLNFPEGLFTPALDVMKGMTFDEKATALIDSQEHEIDRSRAREILGGLKQMYAEQQKDDPTGDRSTENVSSYNRRSDNSLFKSSNETSGGHSGDSGYDEEERSGEGEGSGEGHARGRVTEVLTDQEKLKRAYEVLAKLKNESGIHIKSAERADHRKILMDTIREQGLSNPEDELLDVESLSDVTPSTDRRARKVYNMSSTTPLNKKKSILHSIERAYARALKTGKNGTKDEQVPNISKEYRKLNLNGVMDKAAKSRENKEWMKKGKVPAPKSSKEKKRKEKSGKSKEAGTQGSGEKKKRIDERPPRRFDSKERGRGRYGDDRGRRYSRERNRGRYDSRQARYGDRGRFDSRQRGPPRYDRGPPRYDRGPPRYDRGPPRYDRDDRGPPRYDRGPPRYERPPSRYGDPDNYKEKYDSRPRYDRDRGDRDRRREDRPPSRRDGKFPSRKSRERQTRKKWYSEEAPEATRVFPRPKPEGDRGAPNVRNGGRARMRPPGGRDKDGSFERDYPQFAKNDEDNSMFKKFMKDRKAGIPLGSDVVTIP